MIDAQNDTAERVALKIALEETNRVLRDVIKNTYLALSVLEKGFTRDNHEEAMELLEDTINSYDDLKG